MKWPIFVISLRDAHDRRKQIQKQCLELGLNFEFVDAIDGRQGLPPEFETKIDRAGASLNQGRIVSDGEFACALSHQMIYERIVREDLKGAIVLEDDAILTREFANFVNGRGYLRADFIQMDYLAARYYLWQRKQKFQTIKIVPIAQNAWLSSAYSISKSAAIYILSKSQPLADLADWPCDLMPLKPCITLPTLARQPATDISQSSLESGRAALTPTNKKQNRWKRFGRISYWKRWLLKRTTRIVP